MLPEVQKYAWGGIGKPEGPADGASKVFKPSASCACRCHPTEQQAYWNRLYVRGETIALVMLSEAKHPATEREVRSASDEISHTNSEKFVCSIIRT